MKMSDLMPGMIIKSKFSLILFFDKYGSYDFCERLPNNQKMIVLRRSQKSEGYSNKLSAKVYSFHNQKILYIKFNDDNFSNYCDVMGI